MGIILGIDIGGSTTKICGFHENGKLIEPLSVKADDPVSSIYGAFGKFTSLHGILLSQVERVMVTGAGSSYISDDLYGIPTEHVREFDCIGLGGQYLAGLSEAIVVSMGTGTALVHVKGDSMEYLGGTGVGGGTLFGLSETILDVRDMDILEALAEKGDISKIDLRISDISKKSLSPTLDLDTTASNFGKLSDLATKEDLALGIINLVFETIGMISVFGAKRFGIRDVVLTGKLSAMKKAKTVFGTLGKMFDMNFIFPENARYGTVIGAALLHFHKLRNS
ncbi:MAG: type II pantothenate kinase [Clostridia bacterium]|nr:type II pantothenate kinase [Clostridia bacterium]